MAGRKVIVTGASGFVGRELVKRALGEGWRVAVLDRSQATSGFDLHRNLSVFDWRIGETLPREALDHSDALFHLAAFIPSNFADPAAAEECLKVNALGALGLAEAALKAGIGRFVHFSSGQIYDNRGRAAREDDPTFPASRAAFYLASKLVSEIYIEHFRLARGLPAAILRLSSVYGLGMKKGGVIPRFVAAAKNGARLEVADGGVYAADFVHVGDVAAAALAVVEKKAEGVFNIGAGAATTTLELAESVLRAAGADPSLIALAPATGAPSTGFAALDITKARETFGFAPRRLEDGLKDWFRDTPRQ